MPLILAGIVLTFSSQNASALSYTCLIGPSTGYITTVKVARVLGPSDIYDYIYAESETYARVIQPAVSNWGALTFYGTTDEHGPAVILSWISATTVQVEEHGYFGVGNFMWEVDGTTIKDDDCGQPWIIPI